MIKSGLFLFVVSDKVGVVIVVGASTTVDDDILRGLSLRTVAPLIQTWSLSLQTRTTHVTSGGSRGFHTVLQLLS